MTATTFAAAAAQAFDPESVTPGVIGFAMTAIVAVLVCLLLFDMNRRVRRVKYREEIRADIAAEQAATGDPDVESGGAARTDGPGEDGSGPARR